MNSKDFLSNLSTMTNKDLSDFIQKHGKIKEPTSYDCPWTVIIPEDDDDEKPRV